MIKSVEKIRLFIVIQIIGIVLLSCEKEEFYRSSDAQLKFSVDTVFFDTVFTSIGSATQRVTVKNPYSENILISSVALARGYDSPFRLNVDGIAGILWQDIEIKAKDSLYIFVEITVDPNNSNLPLLVQDSIVFSFNNRKQDIDLFAWGQDVHLINGEILETQHWVNDKPYLVYNSMMIDTNNTLTIDPGVMVYFHKNSRMYVAGTLIAKGTYEEPIIFQGDRLEEMYDNIPGQWDGIWLMPGSKDHLLDFCHIKNAIIGIQVDTLANTAKPTLTLSNSRIENMTAVGLYAQGSTILAYNNLISNCGQFAVRLVIGGAYEFYHCTIANYWGYSTRTTPSLLLNNYYIDVYSQIQLRPVEKALFGNCIIYGNKESEIIIDKADGAGLSYKFDHCLFKVDDEFSTSDPLYFENIIVNQNPKFKDAYEGNFELDTLSIAKDKGKPEYSILFPNDINMNNRNSDAGPDLGAFERIEQL